MTGAATVSVADVVEVTAELSRAAFATAADCPVGDAHGSVGADDVVSVGVGVVQVDVVPVAGSLLVAEDVSGAGSVDDEDCVPGSVTGFVAGSDAADDDEDDPPPGCADDDDPALEDEEPPIGFGCFGWSVTPLGRPGSTGGNDGLCTGRPCSAGSVGSTGTVTPVCDAYTRSSPMTIET